MDIINAVIKAAGWTMIHSLWQGAILYVVLILILKLSPKLSSASKHNLSFLGLLGIFFWSGITFYAQISKAFPVHKASLSFIQSQYSPVISTDIPDMPVSASYQIEQYFPALVFVYLICFIIQIGLLLIDYYKLRKTKITGLTDLPTHLYERCLNLIERSGIKRKIRFHISSRVSVPLVIGYLKPVILLPLSAIARLEPEQFEAIIIHELSHIRRNDYLLNLMKLFVETIMFFNPFVLLTGRVIKNERENACDDLVLEMTGAPFIYIETLFQIQQLKHKQDQFSMAVTGKGYTLLNRIKRIATLEQGVDNKRQLSGSFLILTVIILIGSLLSISWLDPKVKNGKSLLKNTEKAISKLKPVINPKFAINVKMKNIIQILMKASSGSYMVISAKSVGVSETENNFGVIYSIQGNVFRQQHKPEATVDFEGKPHTLISAIKEDEGSGFSKFKVLQSKWTPVWVKHLGKWTPIKEVDKSKWSKIWDKQYSKEEASQLASQLATQQKTEWDKITIDEAKERADLSAINKIESHALQPYNEKLKAAVPPPGYVKSPHVNYLIFSCLILQQ